jgi:hypothetical protein
MIRHFRFGLDHLSVEAVQVVFELRQLDQARLDHAQVIGPGDCSLQRTSMMRCPAAIVSPGLLARNTKSSSLLTTTRSSAAARAQADVQDTDAVIALAAQVNGEREWRLVVDEQPHAVFRTT